MSEVSICNSALTKLGVERIIDLSDNSKAARLCNEQYSIQRDMLLRSHPWNFAIKRATLALSGTSPVHGFDNAFQLPNDYLRALHPLSIEVGTITNIRWQIEGDKIVTDETEFLLRYVAQITDTALFDAMFTECLSLKIAAELAYPLVQSAALGERMEIKYQQFIKQVRSADAQEGTPEQIGSDLWLLSRNRGSTFSATDA